MAPNLARRLLCSNKNAEEQRQEEWELALNQLKSGNRHYKDSVSAVGQRGVKMADAIEIAKAINALTESLKVTGVAVDGDGSSDLNSSLLEASEKLQAYTEQLSRTAKPVQKIVYYDQSSLPNSPQRHSPEKTPKRSNCRGADDLCSATSAFSCASGYLATIGDEDSECFLKTESRESPVKATKIPVGEKGTRLSLDLRGSPTKSKGNRKIRIVDGKRDITILGSGVKALTLQTRSSSSTAENHGPIERPHESREDRGGKKQSSREDFRIREFKHKPATRSQPASAPTNSKQGPLENLVLGAMKTPSRMSPMKARLKPKGVLSDTVPSSSSSVSEFLPSDGHDRKKCKSVKTGDEKGFEVFLDQTAEQKRYSADKLRERANFSEKLQRNRREILDIKQDLELCSMLLDKCNDGTAQRYRSAPHGVLDRIDEQVKPRFASPIRGVKANSKYVDGSPSHRPIIRE